MRRPFLILLALVALSCGTDPSGLPAGGAVVTFAFSASGDTMDVLVLDSATIQRAENRVATGTGPRMPVGPIRRGAGIDPRFPFRFVPESVRLDDLATEVCDGRPMKTPTAVDDFIELATGRRDAESAIWCPWGAEPIRVQRRP
ncbi:MAG: hypothetical protein JNJ80_02555 [Gemmatimonadetes bacterium]|nr:hypothetical protein [Gemmatimonadota bacterium]